MDNYSDEQLLYQIGAIIRRDGDYWFTNAGLLFFCNNPQRMIPHSYIRLLRFSVSYDQVNERGLPTLDRRFEGPLTKQIRDVRVFFRESAFFKRYQKRKLEGGFIEEPEFPPTVIDEAIVNAVVHRDYRTGLPIECELYTDAFIVKNPGRTLQRGRDLPDQFSLSDEVLDSMPRNAKLLEWFKIMKNPDGVAYVQAISEGTKHMLKEMINLKLPAPSYHLSENQTLIKLENRAEEREAAIRAASKVKSTEYSNLFLLKIRRGEEIVNSSEFKVHKKEFMKSFFDVLNAKGWFIDSFKFSRIIAHRRGCELETPENVRHILRFYPAYEFQVREYFNHLYLCMDYKCHVRNVRRLSNLLGIFKVSDFIEMRCIAYSGGEWREGRIINIEPEFLKIYFFDTESEEQVPTNYVIPSLPLAMLDTVLEKESISFDLFTTLKKHSLALSVGSAKERSDKIMDMIKYIAKDLFPFQFGDMEVNLSKDPVQLLEQGLVSEKSLPVYRLPEPVVEFRGNKLSSDIREGITQFGTFNTERQNIELVPICLHSMRYNMKQLIEQLRTGKFKYRGSERTFLSRFNYSYILGVERVEDIYNEIEQLLKENSDWEGNTNHNRIFLVQTPEKGYSKDDHTSPYYKIKRLLFERGIPCQMVDTPTLENPNLKDLNLSLNIIAKCGITPWVLPDAIPDADFFIGLSYTQSKDGRRIMGFANVFNSYGKWEFYSGNTSYFNYEERSKHLARLVEETLHKLQSKLSPTPRIIIHHTAKLSKIDREAIHKVARKIKPHGIFTFVWINSHHNVRLFDNRPETDGSLRRGSYVEVSDNQIYLSTTGYNSYRKSLGTPKPLEISAWVTMPEDLPQIKPDLRVHASQVLNLTKLNWSSTDSFCGEPITLKYAGDIAYLTAAFLRQSEPFNLHPVLEKTPWFI